MAQAVQVPAESFQLPRVGVDPGPSHLLPEVREAAKTLGLTLMPWQELAVSVLTSRIGEEWAYRESAVVVSRQNGKSSIIAPLVRMGLERGERILHTAQNRIIPRHAFNQVVASFKPGEAKIRQANGQEEIRHRATGGTYTIIAPQRGVRGHSADRLIVDEIREFEDFDFVAAAEPTLAASPNPQVNYFSNAGHELSLVLNDLKARAGKDPRLAYLEWSAAPDLDPADELGWRQANPCLGYTPLTIGRLRDIFNSKRESGQLAVWETEHLCRWVLSMAPRLVADANWQAARRNLSTPVRPSMGISVSPDGSRASAALSWAQGDGSVGLSVLADVTGSPVDLEAFGLDLRDAAFAAGVGAVAFDPWTDAHLARFFPDAKPLQGAAFANASELFVRSVESGRLRWEWADAISTDLPYTARKATSGNSFIADRADPRRPITGALAAIRAVWLAGDPEAGPPSIW